MKARLSATAPLSSRGGIVPLAPSQDVGALLAKTVTAAAIMLDATVGADPADPATSRSAGRIPPTYTASLRAGALRGARLGILQRQFGDAPEDQQAGRVVRTAIEAMEQLRQCRKWTGVALAAERDGTNSENG